MPFFCIIISSIFSAMELSACIPITFCTMAEKLLTPLNIISAATPTPHHPSIFQEVNSAARAEISTADVASASASESFETAFNVSDCRRSPARFCIKCIHILTNTDRSSTINTEPGYWDCCP